MDKELKARKLGSATVRKQRMQERQRQKELLYEQREERKRRIMRHSEAYSTDGSDSSRSDSPENDSTADTTSECSIATPDNHLSPEVEIRLHSRHETTPRKDEDSKAFDAGPVYDSRRETLKAPMFTASLNRPCDFRYDRFSTFMEPPEALKTEESEDSDDSGSTDEELSEDEYSPIEIATPIAIRMPIGRPSVISVVTTPSSEHTPHKFSVKNIDTIMTSQPKPKAQRIDLTETPQSIHSNGFSAQEAKSAEVLTPSSASVISVAPSSSQSLTSIEPLQADNSLKKKPSMPMLTRAHARMNSIKNFIKPQSMSGPLPVVPMIPIKHQPRPSESLSNILLSSETSDKSRHSAIDIQNRVSARRSVTEPALLKTIPRESRPQTARAVSNTSTSVQEPPLPTYPPASTPSSESVISAEQMDSTSISRKKSFSNLRRRSGSIGQALKFSGNRIKSPASDVPPPPVPAIRISVTEPLSISLPSPSPRTPRSFRKSGMSLYSAFPPAQKGDPVGLGLRL